MKLLTELSQRYIQRRSLIVDTQTFQITELEWYYNSKAHNDTYVHCNEEQSQPNIWYFHKYKNGTYKNGTFKGLDYTLTQRERKYFDVGYIGFLIRGIRNINTGEIIEGPCNVVHHIMKILEVNTIVDLVENKLELIHWTRDKHDISLLRGPRIGLSDKDTKYKDAKYRYATLYTKKKKTQLKLYKD